MHQVLLQRGCHSFIRYCASESVFAGLRRIAKLATGIAIAVAFTGIALPTSSAQAQTATLAATGNSSISDGEEKTFTLTLDELPTNRNITHATVTLIVRGDNPLLDHPSGTGYEGASFDVIVTGDNDRAVTLNRQSGTGKIQKRMSVTIPLDPTSSTAGAGQPAVITYTVRGKSVLDDQSFSLATFAKSFSFRDNNSNDFELSDLAVTGSPQPFTVAASDDRVLLTYGYPNGATIPNFKAEEPDSYTGLAGNLWSGGRNLLLASGVAAHYTDGTVYQCAESSTGNCVINLGAFSGAIGRIVAGGPVHVTALGIPPTAVSAIAADDAAEGEDIDVTITLDQRLPLTASGVGRVAYAVAGRGASPIDPAADVTVASPATFSADGTGPTLTFTIAANADNLVESDETGTVTVTGITWSGGDLTGLSESADFAVSDAVPAPPPPVTETQDPRLIYTYENLAVIPDHLFKSEEPTNASSAGITWTDGESLAITHNATATYSDGTTYECLSGGGCVITFASRQINNGGQVRISQPFEIGSQQFIPGASAGIRFSPTGIPGTHSTARSIVENQGTGVGQGNSNAGINLYQVDPSGFPGNVTAATCVYGLGGDALYLGEDTGNVNTSAGDYVLLADTAGTRILLTDSRFSLPEERDADVNHLFTDACGPGVITPTRIRITADDINEPNEVIGIVLKRVTLFIGDEGARQELGSARVSEPDALAVTITNDDDTSLPEISFTTGGAATADGASINEGTGAQYFLLVDKGARGVVVDYSILGTGVTASDLITTGRDSDTTVISAISANNDTVGTPNILTQTSACAAITDSRCGTITLNNTAAVTVEAFANRITITFGDDSLAESAEDVTLTLYPRDDDDGNRTSIFPNFNTIADRSRTFTIPANGTTTVELVDADTDGDFIYGAAVVLERSAANTSTSLNNTFTLNAATNATLGYLLTGPGAGDIAVTAGSGDAANTTAVTPNDDPRGGTFTVTGTTGTTGSLQLTAAADAVLEGTESFTLTLYAGNPDDTRLALANGTKNYTITDATDATARLTWPGTTTRTGGEQRDSRGDASSPIGESVFPGGVLEGASPHVLLDLHVTGDDTTPVTVGRDLFFPISCRRMTGTSTFSTPNCGPLGLDIRIESINDDKGTSARSDDTIAHGFFIRAGRSQEATGINIVPDANAEPDETFVFNTGAPIEFRGQATPVGIGDRVTPFATDASLTVHDRPVDAGDITWMPEDPAQADFGAGLTKIADLVITLPGGFTADHSAVTVDYTYNGSDALGSMSFRDPDNTSNIYATRDVILRNEDDNVIGTRERITVLRTSFSKAAADSDPTATVGLYFSPAASGSGERPTVDVKKVSHADLLTVSFDRDLCNDGLPGEAPGSDPCDNQEFGVGIPMVDFPSAGQDLSASEAGDTGGFSIQIVNNDSPTEAEPNFFPANAAAEIAFTLGGTARRGLSSNSRDYVLSLSRSTNADGTGSPVDITDDVTFAASGLTGTVPLAYANRAQYINFLVTPNADDVNDDNETVEIRIAGVTFDDAGTTTDITVNRSQTVTIANAPVPAIMLGAGGSFIIYNRLQGSDGATTSSTPPTGHFGGPNEGLGGSTPQVRLWITDIPADAYYATLSQRVVTGALPNFTDATYGGGTNGNSRGGDYSIAGSLWPEDPEAGGANSAWIPATRSITVNRGGDQIGHAQVVGNVGQDGFQADQWLVLRNDGVEGPEIVVIDYSLEVFGCSDVGYQPRGTSCTNPLSQADKIGDTLTQRAVFRITDGEGTVREVRVTPASVVEDVAEGASQSRVNITVSSDAGGAGFDSNSEIAYTITGEGITAEDFVDANADGDNDPLTGLLLNGVNSNPVGFVTIANDDLGEDAETFTLTLNEGTQGGQTIRPGASALVTIAESDGGGPPPVLGPTGRITTTGPVNIVRNADTRTEVTFTAENMELASPGDAANTFVFFDVSITPDSGDDWTDSDFEVRTAETGSTVYVTTLDGDVGRFRANDGISTLFRFGGLDPGVNDDGSASISFWMHTDTDNGDGEETFTIALDRVYSCGPDVGGECPEPANILSDSDDGGATIAGSALTVNLNDPPAAKTVSVAASDDTATEASTPITDSGQYTFALSETSTAETVINFTVDTTTSGHAVAGTCSGTIDANGNCTTYTAVANRNNTVDYYLATRSGTTYTGLTLTGGVGAESITIPANTETVDLFLLPVQDALRISARDAKREPALITITSVTNTGETVELSSETDALTATVTVVDPGLVSLSRVFGQYTNPSIGGRTGYQINLRNIGTPIASGAYDPGTNNTPVVDGNGNQINAVVELDLPPNGNLTVDPNDATFYAGANYGVRIFNGDFYELSSVGSVLTIVVPQTTDPATDRLRRILGGSSGAAAGAEEITFDIVGVTETSTPFTFTMDAYTVLTSDGSDRTNLYESPLAANTATNTITGPPAVVLSDVPAAIPAEFDFSNPTQVTFTNPFGRTILGANPVYTFSITPTGENTDAFEDEIEILVDRRVGTGPDEDNPQFPGTTVTTFTPVGDADVVQFTAQSLSGDDLVANGTRALDIFLKAGVPSSDARTFNIALTRVLVEDSDSGTVINGPPAAAQLAAVSVAASTEASARLNVTSPLMIDYGDEIAGGTDTATFNIVLDNIPAEVMAGEDTNIVQITLDFTASTTTDTPGGGDLTFNSSDGVGDGCNCASTFYYTVTGTDDAIVTNTDRTATFQYDADADGVSFVDSGGNRRASFPFSIVNTEGLAEGNISFIISSVVYLDASSTNEVTLEEGQISDGEAAARTFTIVDPGTLRSVSLSPTGQQEIADVGGTETDFTVSLTRIFNDIDTASVNSAILTLGRDAAQGNAFATAALSNAAGTPGKRLNMSGTDILLELPALPADLVFIPDDANTAQVAIPAGIAEFVITVSIPGDGDFEDTLTINQVAYLDSSDTDLNGPQPHIFGSIQFASVDDPVVVALSSARRTIIGTGGGAQGMTEFSLTATNMDSADSFGVFLTLGGIGGNPTRSGTTITGDNYILEVAGPTGNVSGDVVSVSNPTDDVVTVSFTAGNVPGPAGVNFRITTTPTAAAQDFTISIDDARASNISTGNVRNIVTQTTSLAYQIVSATTVPSISVSNTAAFEIDFATDTLTVNEGDAADAKTFQIKPSHLTAYIEMLNPGVDVATGHIDVTLRATDLTFNQANGKTITLGNAAATLTIASGLVGHEFVNDTAGSSTAILRISGVQTSTITFTGGFVDSDVDFTLAPTAVAYFDSSGDPLDGPAPRFTGGRFSVDAMEAAARIESADTNLVVGDDGKVTVTLEGYALANSSGENINTVTLQMAFSNDGGTTSLPIGTLDADTRTWPTVGGLFSITVDGDDTTGTLSTTTNARGILIDVPRARLLAGGGEARGYEEVVITLNDITAEGDYVVTLSQAASHVRRGESFIPVDEPNPDPAAVTFAVAPQGTATLAIDADDRSPSEAGNASGGFDLTLTGVSRRATDINYVIPAPGEGDAIPGDDYTLRFESDVEGNVDQPDLELNPEDGSYTGTFTIRDDVFASSNNAVISISIEPETDGIVEGPETVTLMISEIPGVTYTATEVSLDIADNDNAVAVVVLNGRVVDGSLNSALVREGFTYPVQIFLVAGTTTDLIETTVSGGTPAVLAGDATFTLTLADGGGTGYTADDVSLASNTITILAGESSGQTTLTVAANDDAADPDTEERFRLFVSTSDGNVLPPGVQRGQEGDFNAAIIIAATAAPTGFCEGRTPAVALAILTTMNLPGIADCGDANADATNREAVGDGLSNLTTLDLSGTTLTSLQPGDFASLSGLLMLDLGGANVNLRALPAGVFPADLASLTSLNLSGNSLTNSHASIPEDVFDELDALTTLNLGDNTTLTGLPVGVLNGVLDTLGGIIEGTAGILTIPTGTQARPTMDVDAIDLTQGGTVTVPVRLVNAAGDPQPLPMPVYLSIRGVDAFGATPVQPDPAVEVSNNLVVDGVTVSATRGVVIPAGVTRVDATFTAETDASPGEHLLEFIPAQTFTADIRSGGNGFALYPYADGTGVAQQRMVRRVMFDDTDHASVTTEITTTVLAPVVLDPATADAAELNNDPAAVEMTLNRTAADIGTADVTFTLAGGNGLGTDYRLAITDPDGNAVNDTSGSELVLADAATGGTFRLPADVSAATFTLTPIADGFLTPAEGNEDITIAVTAVDYDGANAPAAQTITDASAVITITDNPTAPGVEVVASTLEGDDTEITENDGDDQRGTFTISLADAPEGVATVAYTLAVSDETDSTEDFDAIDQIRTVGLGGEVPAAPGGGTFTMTVADGGSTATGDLAFTAARDDDQVGESVTLTVNGVTFADDGDGTNITASDSATISIVDDDPVDALQVDATDPEAIDGIAAETGTFTFSGIELPVGAVVAFTLDANSTAALTAVFGTDYTLSAGTHMLTANASGGTITTTAVVDEATGFTVTVTPAATADTDTTDDTVILTITGAMESGGTAILVSGTDNSATVTIREAGTMSMAEDDTAAAEASSDVGTFLIELRDVGVAGDLAIPYTVSGTAGDPADDSADSAAAEDYDITVTSMAAGNEEATITITDATGGTINLTAAAISDTTNGGGAGAATITVTITPLDGDNRIEATETVILSLTAPTGFGYTEVPPDDRTVEIADNSTNLLQYNLVNTSITVTEPATGSTTFSDASTYTALRFSPVTDNQDIIVERPVTVQVRSESGSADDVDDDGPPDFTKFTRNMTLNGSTGTPITVTTAAPITQSVSFDVLADDAVEPLQFFRIRARDGEPPVDDTAVSTGVDEATISITDVASPLTVAVRTTQVAEGDGDAGSTDRQIEVAFSAPDGTIMQREASVSLTTGDSSPVSAVAGTDYTAIGTAVTVVLAGNPTFGAEGFLLGKVSGSNPTVAIAGDADDDDNETFIINLSGTAALFATNGITAENTITIIDNDGAAVPVINAGLEYEAIAPAGLVHLENLAYSDISGSVIVPAGTTPDSAVTHFVYVSSTGPVNAPRHCDDATIAANTEILIAQLGAVCIDAAVGFTGFAPDGATITFRLRNAVGLSAEATLTIREAAATVTSVELKAYDAATGGNEVADRPVPIAEGSAVYQRLEANAPLDAGETLRATVSELMSSEDASDADAVAADLTSNDGGSYSLADPAQNSASYSLAAADDNIVEGPEFFQIVTDDVVYNQASVAVTPAFGGETYQTGGRLIYRIDDNDTATAIVHVGTVTGQTGTDDPDNSVPEGSSVQAWVEWMEVGTVLAVDATFTLDLEFAGGGDATDVTLPGTATVIIPAGQDSSLDHGTPASRALTLGITTDAAETGETFTVGIMTEVYGEGRQSGIEGLVDESGRTASISIEEAPNICGRTDAVETAILAAINALPANNGVGCTEVMNTSAHLSAIRTLSVTGVDGLLAGDFVGLTGMTTLSLTGSFTTLPAGVFNAPDELTSLTLDGVLTGDVPKVFDNLVDLVTLDLSDNAFDDITDAAFDSLTGLMTLNLSGNSIDAVSDATIFTPLAALATLNLGGNTTLSLANGALDPVLDTLTSLTWPTQRTASFVEDGVTVGRSGTANITVTLGGTNTLPVGVSIPITATLGTISVVNAVIPAGTTSVMVPVTATSAVAGVGGSIMLGNPTITGASTPVRTALIANNADTATLTVVDGPTATLTGSADTTLTRGDMATISVELAGIDASITGLAGFAHVKVELGLGGTAVRGNDYTPTVTSRNTSSVAFTASTFTFYVAAANISSGTATVNLEFAIENVAAFAPIADTIEVTIMEAAAVNAAPALANIATGDFTPSTPRTLTYTVVAPATLSADATINEGTSHTVTLTLENPAPVTGLMIPFTVAGTSTAVQGATNDYTITADTPGNFVFSANNRERASITIVAEPDRTVDSSDKTVIITLTAGTYPPANGFTIAANEIFATYMIGNTDTAPTGVTVSASPEQIDETGDTNQSTITVELNEPAPANMAVNMAVGLDYTLTGTADLGSTCSASADYTAAMGGTALTSTGSLSFAAGTPGGDAGERSKTITITACEDEVDESAGNGETVIFTILTATAAANNITLTSAVSATITIEDSPVAQMEEIMMQVETVATVVATEHVSALTGLIRQRFSATSSFASPPRVPTGAVPAPSTDTNLSLSDNPENMNDMINSMGLESSAQGDSNDRYAVWIRGQRSAFEGTPEVQGLTVNYDGTSTGVGVGAEYISSGYLMGLAMNFVTTEVDLSTEGGEGSESITKYEESIVIAAPYISLKASEGTSMWASAGYGSGTADAKLSGETKSADVSLSFLNAGADFTVVGMGFEIVTGLSGLVVRKVVDAFTFADTVIPETTIDTMQGVGEITVYRPIHIAGQILRPYVGVSTIHDFGDIVADDDHGLGIRSGVAFNLGRISTDIEVSSELLRENRRQWTVSGGMRFASRPGGLGLSLALEGTQETLMDTEDATDDADRTWGVGLESGYGISMDLLHPDGVLTPFASVDQTGNGRDMSGGMRFSVGNGLSLDLETTRQMHDDGEDASEHKAGLRGKWSF